MDESFKYRAFISYSHADSQWAAWLHKSLETYRIPKHLVGRVTAFGPIPERIAPVFRDREELASATNLGDKLTNALRQSAMQIVICSPAAARSRWVNEEILTFKRLGREDRIFALIVGGEPGASARPETAADESPAGLEFALRDWIGDDRQGQLGYFRRKTVERLAQAHNTERLSNFGLWASAATLALLLFVSSDVLESFRANLVFAVGCVLLMIGVRQSYAKATGESEIIKQYEFMIRIFGNARRRLDQAENDGERRRVLRILGDAALEEHGEWLLMHRQRSIDARDIVRLS
jgi:hypothetical protein